MNPVEAGSVLTIASALDARMTPPSPEDAVLRARLWSETLDYDMPVAWAQKAVAAHYKANATVLMPSDLNAAWKAEKRAESDRQAFERQRQEIEAAKQQATAMPESVREFLAGLRTKEVPND